MSATVVTEATRSPLARRRGGRGWAWILTAAVIATGGAICGWAIYLDLNHYISRHAFIYGIGFAFVPVIPLVGLMLWLDRSRPEPPWLLLTALVWGGTAAAYLSLKLNGWLSPMVGDVYGASARGAVFIAPWTEELAKGTVVFAIVLWRRHDFSGVIGGMVYGGLAGIGFAFTENILYYTQQFELVKQNVDEQAALDAVESLFLWRGVAMPFVHPMFTMMTGVGIGVAIRHRHVGTRILAPVAGFCAASLLHMGYNSGASFATSKGFLLILFPTLLGLVWVVLAVRRYEARLDYARLADYTRFGWLKADQLQYVVSRRGRRQARKYARQLGEQELDRVRAFQVAGMDLALVRDRMVRGVVGASDLQSERELLTSMRSLRRQVRLPGEDQVTPETLVPADSSW